MLKTFVVEKFEKDCENQGVWKKMTCEDPLASGYPTAVQLSRRSSRSSQKFVMRRVIQLLANSKKTKKTNNQQCINHGNKNISFLFWVLFFSRIFCRKT